MKHSGFACGIAITLLLVMTNLVGAADEPGDFVEVSSGDTLFGLVRLHYPGLASRWSFIENEIYKMNPGAFVNGNKDSLRRGAILKMPVYEKPAEKKVQALEPAPVLEPRHSLATVGIVAQLSGTPLAIDLNNDQRILQLGSDIYRGDAILTEGDSAAQLQMNDGARLYLRAQSRLVIEDYSFIESTPTASRSIITLLKGGFRAITGLIGRHNPASVRINTAVATIGVRGTDFALRICAPGECSLPEVGEFAAGDYSGVLGGEITINNAAGETPVTQGEVMRTRSPEVAPEPAPEAAALIFTEAELALLTATEDEPLGFFQWLRSWLFGSKTQ